jgi:hypothetical protein
MLIAWTGASGAGPGKVVVDELVEAVLLTDSPERAIALGALAAAEEWDLLRDEAVTHAEEAVRAARRSGSQLALAAALCARGHAHLQDFAATPLADAQEAARLARSCGSTDRLEETALLQVNCLNSLGRTCEASAVAQRNIRGAGFGWVAMEVPSRLCGRDRVPGPRSLGRLPRPAPRCLGWALRSRTWSIHPADSGAAGAAGTGA